MSTTFEQILEDVSYALIEPLVQTTLGTSVAPGTFPVTPPNLNYIYPGALLIVGTGATQEVVTVTSVAPPSFTATFANAHASTDPVVAATFPSGQTDAPLFTQTEMIAYVNEVQNDFLLRVRLLYAISDLAITRFNRFYAQPSNCIRLERIAMNPSPGAGGITMDLVETSQTQLDLLRPYWLQTMDVPQQWFRDQVNTAQFGLYPLPSANFTLELWYSIRNTTVGNTLTTVLLVPDVFQHFIKYGVLARAWTKDGETRDPQRAQYCLQRYNLGVVLAVKFMTGLGIGMERGSQGDPDFSPMPLQPQGAQS